MDRSRTVRLMAVGLLVAGLGYVGVEAVVASAWTDPTYSYVTDQVPDLGNPVCGPFEGRVVCSPLHAAINTMSVVHGLVLGVAGVLLSRLLTGSRRTTVLVCSLVYPVGLSTITVFYQHPGMSTLTQVLNITGAFVGIFAGSIIAVVVGARRRHLGLPRWFGPVSVVLGVVGIAAGVVFFAFSPAPLGVRERVAIYPLMAWEVLAGLVLLRSSLTVGAAPAAAVRTP